MVGKSLALAYVLLERGARTPDAMHELDALFLHRDQPITELHRIYCELVNLDHPVEFFHFGKEAPIETIFGSGAYDPLLLTRYYHSPLLRTVRLPCHSDAQRYADRSHLPSVLRKYRPSLRCYLHDDGPSRVYRTSKIAPQVSNSSLAWAKAVSVPVLTLPCSSGSIIKNIQNGIDAGQIAVVDRQGLSADSDLATIPPEDLLDPSLAVAALIPDRSLGESRRGASTLCISHSFLSLLQRKRRQKSCKTSSRHEFASRRCGAALLSLSASSNPRWWSAPDCSA